MTSPAKPADLVTVNIDGREIAVPKGTNVIEAARQLGIEIPHYCYHPKLSVSGNCRMCLIEMGTPAVEPTTRQPIIDPTTGKPRINWIPKPQIGCFTPATAGLHIRTASPLVKECREGVTEFLLINHPLDCPICDQAGECRLQEHSTAYGRGYSRFVENKNVKPKRTALGPRVTLDDERCILCSRCVRFCKEVAKDDVLGFIDRGSYSTLTCYPGRKLENNYSLNTVDICPVGALTSTDFRFKMRVWFLKATPGIDPESSVGVNTEVWSREGAIYRITPRRNDEVNDTWMADSGRLLYKQVRADDRLTEARVDGAGATHAAALKATRDLLVGRGVPADVSAEASAKAEPSAHPEGSPYRNAVAVVGSGRNSVEEQFLTKKLADALKAPAWLVSRVGPGDGLLISADRNPNVRGALVTGLIKTLPYSGGAATSPRANNGDATLPAAVRAPRLQTDDTHTDALRGDATPSSRLSGGDEGVGAPSGIRVGGLADLAAAIDAGKVKTVVSVGEDLAVAGLTAAQFAKVAVVYLGTHRNATSDAARVVLPTLTVFEKNGTFINQQFRLQKFVKAVPGPQGVADDLVTLGSLVAAVDGALVAGDINALWAALAAEVKPLAGVAYASLPATGLLLDGAPFASLPFVEGETLHFKPAAKPAAANA